MSERFKGIPDSYDKLAAIVHRQCWSIFEGCVCRYHKEHDGYHECDSPDCNTFWTDEEAADWANDQSQDNHKSK